MYNNNTLDTTAFAFEMTKTNTKSARKTKTTQCYQTIKIKNGVRQSWREKNRKDKPDLGVYKTRAAVLVPFKLKHDGEEIGLWSFAFGGEFRFGTRISRNMRK